MPAATAYVGYFAIQYFFAISHSWHIGQLPRRLDLVGDPATIALARERRCDLSARSLAAWSGSRNWSQLHFIV